MPARGPELELGIAARAQLYERILPAIVQLHRGERLRVAAIQPFGQPQDRRKRAHGPPQP